MTRPLDPTHVDEAIRLYLAGEPVEQIHTTTGVSPTVFHRERARRGIPTRWKRRLPEGTVIAAYLSGASELALSKQYGVARGVVSRILRENQVPRRDPKAASGARVAQMTPAERKRQTEAAHEAVRGRRRPLIEKYRKALRNEQEGQFASDGEKLFAQYLDDLGVRYAPQRAIGLYNVDFAVLPVAVEILGGGWHANKATHAERIPDILDQGWHLVMIWNYEGRSALGPGAAEYLVAFLEEARRNPPATCQYRVITGQGELLTACGREADQFPLVPPPRGSLRPGA